MGPGPKPKEDQKVQIAVHQLVAKELDRIREIYAWSERMRDTLQAAAREHPDRYGFEDLQAGDAPPHFALQPIARAWVK